MPKKQNKNAPKKNISQRPNKANLALKQAEPKLVNNMKKTSNNMSLASENIRKQLPAIIVAMIIVLSGIYVSLPGRYHFLGDVKKATAQEGVTYRGVNGQNALKLLEGYHTVKTTSYGSLGAFVTSIDGVAASKSQYWAFYINGKLSQVGASSYITKSSDSLSWKLVSLN